MFIDGACTLCSMLISVSLITPIHYSFVMSRFALTVSAQRQNSAGALYKVEPLGERGGSSFQSVAHELLVKVALIKKPRNTGLFYKTSILMVRQR
jgi:hypothetical protein